MKTLVFLILAIYIFSAAPAAAQSPCPPGQVVVSYSGSGVPVCGPACTADKVSTALGCIPTEPAELVKWILKKAILLGGGVAFLLSLWGGIQIILAGGNPEKINEGKEIITSAVSGILFIIFSVLLLRVIGVDILGILS